MVNRHDAVEREGRSRVGDISCGEEGGWGNWTRGEGMKFSGMFFSLYFQFLLTGMPR